MVNFRCDNVTKCDDPNTLRFNGLCRDVFDDGVCGKEAIGERLYLGEDGAGVCDCADGWIRYEDRCHQEFTPAFCPPNKILRLSPPQVPSALVTVRELKILKKQLKLNISCVDNPCQEYETYSLPHISTWSEGNFTCHRVAEDLTGCEVIVGKVSEDDTGETGPLRCCHPASRNKCYYSGQITPFSVTLNCIGNCKCPPGKIWSKFIEICVTKYAH